MDLREIVEDWLKENNYDGLVGDECGCGIGDLFPCEYPSLTECKPGYKKICNRDIEELGIKKGIYFLQMKNRRSKND